MKRAGMTVWPNPAAGLSGGHRVGLRETRRQPARRGVARERGRRRPRSSTAAAAFGKPVERSGESARNGSGAEKTRVPTIFAEAPKRSSTCRRRRARSPGAPRARRGERACEHPRFDAITSSTDNLPWIVPRLLAGWAGALLYKGGSRGFRKLSSWIGDHPSQTRARRRRAGSGGAARPYVPFPGKEQTLELMGSWESIGALALLATGATKCPHDAPVPELRLEGRLFPSARPCRNRPRIRHLRPRRRRSDALRLHRHRRAAAERPRAAGAGHGAASSALPPAEHRADGHRLLHRRRPCPRRALSREKAANVAKTA